MDDVAALQTPDKVKADIVLAETTSGRCKLNGPWSKPGCGVEYVLERVGLVATHKELQVIADSLFKTRKYLCPAQDFAVRIVCFGKKRNRKLGNTPQILWPSVISFISTRFREHEDVKAEHQHWDWFGQYLWEQLRVPNLPDLGSLAQGWQSYLHSRISLS